MAKYSTPPLDLSDSRSSRNHFDDHLGGSTMMLGSEQPLASDSQQFKNQEGRATSRSRLYLALGFGGFGVALAVAGVLWFTVPVNYILIGFGIAFPLIAVLGNLQASRTRVLTVTITDTEVRMTTAGGEVKQARWDSQPLLVRIVHAVEHPPGTPVDVAGRILDWDFIHTDVTTQVADALIDRAQRLGLQVSRTKERFSIGQGAASILEVVQIREASAFPKVEPSG